MAGAFFGRTRTRGALWGESDVNAAPNGSRAAVGRPSRRSTLLASNFASAARKSGQTSRRVAGPSGPTRAMSSDSRWKRKLALYAVTAGAGYYGARLGDPIAPVAAPARRARATIPRN
jgi:hypothetical protein